MVELGMANRLRAGTFGLMGALAGLLVLAGCANTRGGTVPYDVQDFGRPDVVAIAPLPVDSRIGPADELTVTVFRVEDLSGDHRVDPNGFIDMPLIGRVQAAGKTSDQLATEIETRFAVRHLRDPSVQVSLKKLTDQTVTVDGAVEQPGAYPVRGGTTLQQAIALAKGLEEEANARRVVIFRQIDGKRHAAAFDLQAIRRAEADDPAVYGNDIVVVDGSKNRSIFRDLLSTLPLIGIFRPF